jgi:hypothetical protein
MRDSEDRELKAVLAAIKEYKDAQDKLIKAKKQAIEALDDEDRSEFDKQEKKAREDFQFAQRLRKNAKTQDDIDIAATGEKIAFWEDFLAWRTAKQAMDALAVRKLEKAEAAAEAASKKIQKAVDEYMEGD